MSRVSMFGVGKFSAREAATMVAWLSRGTMGVRGRTSVALVTSPEHVRQVEEAYRAADGAPALVISRDEPTRVMGARLQLLAFVHPFCGMTAKRWAERPSEWWDCTFLARVDPTHGRMIYVGGEEIPEGNPFARFLKP